MMVVREALSAEPDPRSDALSHYPIVLNLELRPQSHPWNSHVEQSLQKLLYS